MAILDHGVGAVDLGPGSKARSSCSTSTKEFIQIGIFPQYSYCHSSSIATGTCLDVLGSELVTKQT